MGKRLLTFTVRAAVAETGPAGEKSINHTPVSERRSQCAGDGRRGVCHGILLVVSRLNTTATVFQAL